MHNVSKVIFFFQKFGILTKSGKSSNLNFGAKIQDYSWILYSKMYQKLELLGQKSRFCPKIAPNQNHKMTIFDQFRRENSNAF